VSPKSTKYLKNILFLNKSPQIKVKKNKNYIMSDQEGPSPKKLKTTEENDDLDAERVSSTMWKLQKFT